MRRRRLLGASVTLLAGAFAGCIGDERSPSGPRSPPETPRDGQLEEDADPQADDPETDDEDDPPEDTDDGEDSPEPTDPPGDLRVESLDFGENEEGMLVVTVVVDNVSDAERSGDLRVEVTADDEVFVVTREVTVEAGGSDSYELQPGIEFGRFAADGVIDASVTPAE